MQTKRAKLILLSIFILGACDARELPSAAVDSGLLDGALENRDWHRDPPPGDDDAYIRRDVGRDVLRPDLGLQDSMVPDNSPQKKCTYPNHSMDCSLVGYFQCGFEAHCQGNTVVANWHEHVFCPGQPFEEIVNYICTYECPAACVGTMDWPDSGDQLVDFFCVEPATDGGSADAGVD